MYNVMYNIHNILMIQLQAMAQNVDSEDDSESECEDLPELDSFKLFEGMDEDDFDKILKNTIKDVKESNTWRKTGRHVKSLDLNLMKTTLNSCLSYVNSNTEVLPSIPKVSKSLWSDEDPRNGKFSDIASVAKVLLQIKSPKFLHESISNRVSAKCSLPFIQSIAKYLVYVHISFTVFLVIC